MGRNAPTEEEEEDGVGEKGRDSWREAADRVFLGLGLQQIEREREEREVHEICSRLRSGRESSPPAHLSILYLCWAPLPVPDLYRV